MAKKPVKKSAKAPPPPEAEEDVIDDGEDLGGGELVDSLGSVPRGGSAEMPLEGGEGEKPVEKEFLKRLLGELRKHDVVECEAKDAKKALWAEAKARGYSVGILRAAVASLDRDSGDLYEEQTLFEVYREALKS